MTKEQLLDVHATQKKCLGPNGAVRLFFRHILKGAESDVNLADGSGR